MAWIIPADKHDEHAALQAEAQEITSMLLNGDYNNAAEFAALEARHHEIVKTIQSWSIGAADR